MAQFLTVALKASLIISKKKNDIGKILTTDFAKTTVEENFDLSLYDYVETDHNLIWKLKDEVLAEEITAFLNAILTFYYQNEEAQFQTLIKEVGRVKTYEGLLKVANEEVFDHFVLNNNEMWQIHLKKIGKHLQVDYNMIQLFSSERMRYDNFDKTMLFLENTMQKAFSEFRLSKALNLFFFDDRRR